MQLPSIGSMKYWTPFSRYAPLIDFGKIVRDSIFLSSADFPLKNFKEYYELNYSIIKKYCQTQQYDDAKELAKEFPEKIGHQETINPSGN